MTDCITTPERPHQPAVPARIEPVQVLDWNAGANSVAELAGNVLVRFTMDRVVGVVLGLVADRASPANMARITHGILFSQSPGGSPRWQVIEAGAVRTAARDYVPDDTEFRIERRGAGVVYLADGELVYASRVPSTGTAICGTALYASGDTVPGEAW